MKKCLFYLLLAISFNCNAQNNKGIKILNDTVKRIMDINVVGNNLLKGLSDLEIFDILDDTLFLIRKESIIQIDIKSGKISTNLNINLFLNKQLNKNKYANKLIVKNNHFYTSSCI